MLRQVREEDAEELLEFFREDLVGWKFFDRANDMLDEMRKCIKSWLSAYANRTYIRFTAVDKTTGKAIGSIEIYDNIHREKKWKLEAVRHGFVMHINLALPYETRESIGELLKLADDKFFRLFGFNHLLIRAVPGANERIAALLLFGYEPFEWERGREHYYVKAV